MKIVGGGIAGMVFTPIPWKLLDDLSIWTQNWSWIPVPLKGDIDYKYSICSICSAGCAVRARCVGSQPVSVWGIKNHPVNNGALCPLGLGGHHLAYHPARLRQPVKLDNDKNKINAVNVDIAEIISSIQKNIKYNQSNQSDNLIAILDDRPDRTVSCVYRSFLAQMPNGTYITTGSDGMDSMQGLYDIFGTESRQFGFNIEKARTIVSFGAPLLEGWGIPGRVMNARKNGCKILQIETRFSHTASVADRWLPVKPGTEAIFAIGLAHLLIYENLIDTNNLRFQLRSDDNEIKLYKEYISNYTPAYVAGKTGLKEELIRDVAREITTETPSLILCGREPVAGPFSREEQIAIWGLNFLLGNIGPDNLIVPRSSIPAGTSFSEGNLADVKKLSDVPDHSIRVLMIDEAESGNTIPWSVIEQKLVTDNPLIISLSPYLVGMTKRAHYVVPSPTLFESYQDIPPSFDSRTATYAVSAPLYTPPEHVISPTDFIKRLGEDIGIHVPNVNYTDMIKERAAEIYKKKRGWIYTPHNERLIETSDVLTGQQFWSHLNNGGYWIDEPLAELPDYTGSLFGISNDRGSFEYALQQIDKIDPSEKSTYPLTLVPFGWRGVVDSGAVTPLITKLYQETEFREGTNRALIHPETGRSHRLRDGSQTTIVTGSGKLTVRIEFNDSIMPDVLHVALGPDQDSITGVKEVRIKANVLSVCTLKENGTWRTTPARIGIV
jgi:menaquinone reductase, molybdopterin-binding-like subunit